MIPDGYVLLVWASALLVPWGAVYLARPALRRPLLWSSAFAVPFGLSEILFAGAYWSPPSLFDLARRVHLDLESFVFLFASGGLAAVAFNVATGRPVDVEGRARKQPSKREAYNVALATPALVFPVALVTLGAPIRAAVVAMAAGAVARVACRPDLLGKTVIGGVIFCGLYALLFGSLVWAQPGYVERFWGRDDALLAHAVGGIPISELLYGASFGAYWSGLYEHWRWTFGPRWDASNG